MICTSKERQDDYRRRNGYPASRPVTAECVYGKTEVITHGDHSQPITPCKFCGKDMDTGQTHQEILKGLKQKADARRFRLTRTVAQPA